MIINESNDIVKSMQRNLKSNSRTNEAIKYDENEILRKIDNFAKQITIPADKEWDLKKLLDKKRVAYMIDDSKPGKLTFQLGYKKHESIGRKINQEGSKMIISKVNEGLQGQIALIPTSKAKSLNSRIMDELECIPKNDELAIPWDADISIQNGNLVLSGHVSSNGFGSCISKIPLKDADRVLRFSFYGSLSDKDQEEIINSGWDIKYFGK